MRIMRKFVNLFVFLLMLAAVAGTGGCSYDWRNGAGGTALVYKSEIRLLDGPTSNQMTIGNNSARELIRHNPGSPFGEKNEPKAEPQPPKNVVIERPADKLAQPATPVQLEQPKTPVVLVADNEDPFRDRR